MKVTLDAFIHLTNRSKILKIFQPNSNNKIDNNTRNSSNPPRHFKGTLASSAEAFAWPSTAEGSPPPPGDCRPELGVDIPRGFLSIYCVPNRGLGAGFTLLNKAGCSCPRGACCRVGCDPVPLLDSFSEFQSLVIEMLTNPSREVMEARLGEILMPAPVTRLVIWGKSLLLPGPPNLCHTWALNWVLLRAFPALQSWGV